MAKYLLSIQSKWISPIKNQTKQYEFRSYRYVNIKTGDKIYICETRRTKHKMSMNTEYNYCWNCAYKTWDIGKAPGQYCSSLIVGEFIIKEKLIKAEMKADLNGNYHYFKFKDYKDIKNLWYEYEKLNFYDKEKFLQNLENKQKKIKCSITLNNHSGNNGHELAFEISQLKIYKEPKPLLSLGFKTAPQFYYKVKKSVKIC